jgi:class 3 adenylate cyclase
VEPENHECITIFFSDVVNYTTVSAELDPQKVSNMLHRFFNRFDALAEKHQVFKVETIGEAWMGVTNCVADQSSDHAKRIALFVLDAVQAANETLIDVDDPDCGYLSIRVCFHSGEVWRQGQHSVSHGEQFGTESHPVLESFRRALAATSNACRPDHVSSWQNPH